MKAQKTMSTPVFFAILAALYVCLLLVSCRTTKATSDHTATNNVDSLKLLTEDVDRLKKENHNLRMKESESDKSGITFGDNNGVSVLPGEWVVAPSKDSMKGPGVGGSYPCPDKPVNTVEIKPDGTIHASGDIKSVNLNKAKTKLTDQTSQLQESEHQAKKDSGIVIRIKEQTWHTTTKKVSPSWMYYAMGIVALIFLVIGWMAHKYKDRLFKRVPHF